MHDATDEMVRFSQQYVDDNLVSCQIIETDSAPSHLNGPAIPDTPKNDAR